jgi:beta-mannosidase
VTLQTHTYTTKFTIKSDEAAGKTVLKLDQVGVVADILVNGVKVGNVDNVYRTYFFKIPAEVLKVGEENIVRIVIQSTVRYTYIEGAKFTPHESWIEYQWHAVWLQPSWVQYARTPANDFGWDWSLAAAPQGIYGGVSLLFEENIIMENPIVTQMTPVVHKNDKKVVEKSDVHFWANFRVIGGLHENLIVSTVIEYAGEVIATKDDTIDHTELVHNDVHNNTQKYHLGHLTIENPELWWPRGHGS